MEEQQQQPPKPTSQEDTSIYHPRKCSVTNRLLHAKDHAAIQLAIVDVDPRTGKALPSSRVYALCGDVRRIGEADDSLVFLAKRDGIIPKKWFMRHVLRIAQQSAATHVLSARRSVSFRQPATHEVNGFIRNDIG
ncbi:hypothetical protein ACJJTC_017842 [Scirpophaga incertulas]